MLSRRQFLTLPASLAAAALLCSCGLRKVSVEGAEGEEQEQTAFDIAGKGLTVAVTGEPNSEILYEYCRPALAELGLSLESKVYMDPQRADIDCEHGRVDCCFLQSKAELNRYKRQNPSDLEPVGAVTYRPLCVYSRKHDTLHAAPLGSLVALPDDLAGQGHALQVLAQEHMVTLANPNALAANARDVVENPRELEFVPMAADELVDALDDHDYAIIPAEVALASDIHVRDSVTIEANDALAAQWYASALVTHASRLQDPRVQALYATMRSEGLSRFLRDRYDLDVLQISVVA